MKTYSRLLSLLLALLMLLSVFPVTASATDFFEYYNEDGDLCEGYYCDGCGEAVTDGYEFNYCGDADDDGLYCDSCFCTTCMRCEEHCICAAAQDNPVEYNESDLEVPELPELPEYPDYSDVLDDLEDLLDRARGEMNTGYRLDHYEDGSIHASTWNLFDLLCGKDNETACIDHLWNSTKYKNTVKKTDATFAGSAVANRGAKFGARLAADADVKKMLTGGIKWTAGTTLEQRYTDMENLLKALKKNAKAAGYSDEVLNKLTIERADGASFAAMQFSIVMEGSFDDDVRPYRYRIVVPEKTMGGDAEGAYNAMLFSHEFTHFLAAVDKETVYDPSVNELTISHKTEASAIRLYLSGGSNYSNPDFTYQNSNVDAEYLRHLNSLMVYYCQLEERYANQAMNALYEKFKPASQDLAMFIFEKWGYEIMPVAIGYLNSKTFNEKGMSYLDKMANLIPELGLIPTDFDMTKLGEIDYGEREYLDYNGGDANNGPGTDLMYKFMARDGTWYALPTKAMFDWVVEKTGKEPFKWEDMIAATVGGAKKSPVRSAKRTPEEQQTIVCPASGPMPADLYEYFQTIAAVMEMEERCGDDVNRRAEVAGRLAALLDDAETLETAMNNDDALDSLISDLENLELEAERISDELEQLLDELDTMMFDAELYYGELDWLEDYADELNELYHAALDTDEELDQTPEELAEELRADYEARVEEIQENLNELDGEIEDKIAEIEEKSEEMADLSAQLEDYESELNALTDRAERDAEELESIYDDIEEFSGLLDSIDSGLEDMDDAEEQEQPEKVISVFVCNEEDEPLAGIGVYYTVPGTSEKRLLAITDEYGIAENTVENVRVNHGWKLSAGVGIAVLDDADNWYLVPEEKTAEFYVEDDGGEITYVIRESFMPEHSDINGDALNAGSLRVVIRGGNIEEAELENPGFYSGSGPRTETVSWEDYYNAMMTRNDAAVTETYTVRFWKQRMTREMATYYGAWLLPLSEDGQLPRQHGERIFSPLYAWQGGAPVSKLVCADDFSTYDPENPDRTTYVSLAFDFGTVNPGRYELAVVLPDDTVHFEEVTVAAGVKTAVSAETWQPASSAKDPLKLLRLKPEVYTTDGRLIYEISEDHVPYFSLSVDYVGRQVWSVVSFDNQQRACVSVPVTYKKLSWAMGYQNEMLSYSGQVYLLTGDSSVHLLPVTYQYYYMTNIPRKGREFRGLYASKVYGIDAEEEVKPAYVEFLELVYDADGTEHYRTVNGAVDFELHWNTNPEDYPETWEMLCEVRPEFAVSLHRAGVLQNYLFRRRVSDGEGVNYSFRTGRVQQEVSADELPDVLVDYYHAARSKTAERVSLYDREWPATGLPGGLTGAASWTTRSLRGAGGARVTLRASSAAVTNEYGTDYRFIFRVSCAEYGHVWEQDGDVCYCSRCGSKDTREMPQIIEYVVPEGVEVEEEPPRGWHIDGLPYPFGTPRGIDCEFAGWAEAPVTDPMTKPRLWEDADEYNAKLRYRDGEYEKVKLYAVFKKPGASRLFTQPENWNGTYAFALENVHQYQNFINKKDSALLDIGHVSEVEQNDYCLTLGPNGVWLDRSGTLLDHALTVTGDARNGYRIGTAASPGAEPAYLSVRDGELCADEEGTYFDLYTDSTGKVGFKVKDSMMFLRVDGFTPYAGSGSNFPLSLFWVGDFYFCTGDELPRQRELILAQVPFRNRYYKSDDTVNRTGLLAGVVEYRDGMPVSVTDVTDKVNVLPEFYHKTVATYRVSYNDKIAGGYLEARVPVTIVDDSCEPASDNYTLQVGGSWQSVFRVGEDAFNHDGQKVYLLAWDDGEVYKAKCLTDPSGMSAALAEWDFEFDIVKSTELIEGSYQVNVNAVAYSRRSDAPRRVLASTGYKIKLINTPSKPFPGVGPNFNPQETREWLEEHFADENLRHAVEQFLRDHGWNGGARAWLEQLGIGSVSGIEDIPNLRDLWVRNNSITEVNPGSVAQMRVFVAGRQDAKIAMRRSGNTYTAELTRVISYQNLKYVRSVTATDSAGNPLSCVYNRATGRVRMQTSPRRGPEDEITVRYEYAVPYGNGRIALMTVFLTPESITEEGAPDNTDSFAAYLRTVVNGTQRADAFRFGLFEGDTESGSYLTVSGAAEGRFAPVTYTEAGVYEYTLVQLPDETLPYHYDSREYRAVVTVNGELTVDSVRWYCGGAAVDCPVFINDWQTPADTVLLEVSVEPGDCVPEEAEEYSWRIEGITEGAPAPVEDTVSASGGEPAVFEIVCPGEGTWSYEITQVPGSNPDCAYDSAVYTVTVTATLTADGIEAVVTSVTRAPETEESGYGYPMVFEDTYADTAIHTHTFENGVCTGCGMRLPTAGYTDVPPETNWAYEGIAFCIEEGLMGSTSTTELTFEPKTACSRAMIVSVLYRLQGTPAVEYTPRFPDVKNGRWYTDAIIWGYLEGVVAGYGDGTFGPSDQITREQLALILKNYAERFTGKDTSARADLNGFEDANKVTWSRDAVQWAVAAGIISGKAKDGKLYLDPRGTATRQEVASILMRFIKG